MSVRPSIEELQRRVGYEPGTGRLYWKAEPPRGRQVGDGLATWFSAAGYKYTVINKYGLPQHRVAFAVMHGRWPEEIDHADCNKANNEWTNLREANRSLNGANSRLRVDNTSGLKGAVWNKHKQRWHGRIHVNGRQISLGYHDTPDEAHRRYVEAATKYFGVFRRLS